MEYSESFFIFMIIKLETASLKIKATQAFTFFSNLLEKHPGLANILLLHCLLRLKQHEVLFHLCKHQPIAKRTSTSCCLKQITFVLAYNSCLKCLVETSLMFRALTDFDSALSEAV